jgi:hypothetical protein
MPEAYGKEAVSKEAAEEGFFNVPNCGKRSVHRWRHHPQGV